jgi:hypothetical protein
VGYGATGLTTVAQAVKNPDGSAFVGTITLTLNATCSQPDGTLVWAGTNTVLVANGAFTVALYPNSSCTPANSSYSARYASRVGGAVRQEFWVVTASTPTTVDAVRVAVVPTPTLTVSLTQLTAGTLGDTLYGATDGVWTKLAGNTTTTRKFLRQAGTGIASAAPAWDTLQSGDIPSLSSIYEPLISAGTTGQYWRGDKSWQTLDKSAVGLGSVENTALSTWVGSTNVTTLGTIATGAFPWANVSGKPSSFTPATHASSHQNGGADEIATATAAANSIPKAGGAGTLASGWIPDLSSTYQPLDADLTAVAGGNPDFSGMTTTKPVKAGTSAPATCAVGELFYDTDATAGQNIYGCTATNVWTLMSGAVASLNPAERTEIAEPAAPAANGLKDFALDIDGVTYYCIMNSDGEKVCISPAGIQSTGTGGTEIDFDGATSGTITVKATAVAGANTLTLPATTDTLAVAGGNVATATALAANGGNCSSGNYPLGVDASGAVESCTALPTASDSVSGIVELATVGETSSGSDTGRVVTPDGLAGSVFGEKVAELVVFDFATDTAIGDGKFYFVIPSSLNGMNLVGVAGQVIIAGTTNATNVDLARCAVTTSGNTCSGTVDDMLSTNLTIDSGENSSADAAAAAVIDATKDDVATGQIIRVDVDAVSTTAAKGLIVVLTFRLS